jgi:beta-glucosidase
MFPDSQFRLQCNYGIIPQLKSPPPLLNTGLTNSRLVFPKNFLWGVSTASYQVEGCNENSQWAEWERLGRIKSGGRSGAACDWWANAERDFDLARDLGLNALRLSVEWSRIEPDEDRWDPKPLERYRELLEALVQRGIRPVVCLHHFTNPSWFEEKGAFLHPDAPLRFARFTRYVVSNLADLCQCWVTFNEPNVYAASGYVLGEFPPGKTGQISTAIRVTSVLAQCHLRAYRVIHDLQPKAEVGWAQHYVVFEPVATMLDRWVAQLLNETFNETFLRLVEDGHLQFPFNMLDGNAGQVKGACDFVGLNVYNRLHVAFDFRNVAHLFGRIFVPEHVPQGDHGVERPYGEAYPKAVRLAVERVLPLRKPVYILENGVPDAQDRIRPWLIVNVIKELHSLIREGHDIRGYFHWTLTDNFEWTEGWNLRFGLVKLNPETQDRTIRDSGRLYSQIVRSNALTPELINAYPSETPPSLAGQVRSSEL